MSAWRYSYWLQVALFSFVPALIGAARAEPAALVLSGGGAKGAYQVGVWKAMTELDLVKDIRVISGTSVGGINAALFASVGNSQKIESVWLNSMGDVMRLNTNKVHEVLQKGVDACSGEIGLLGKGVKEDKQKEAQRLGISVTELPVDVVKRIERRAESNFTIDWVCRSMGRIGQWKTDWMDDPDKTEGYVDPGKLKSLIERNLSAAWNDDAPIVYVTAVEKGTGERKVFRLNSEPFPRKVAMLQATSAIPELFSTVEIDGRNYCDGGVMGSGIDNVPGDPVLENHPEIKTVYVVYLNDERHLGGSREDARRYSDRRLVEIVPSENLYGYFGALNFDADHARRLIKLGYDDAMKVLVADKRGR